MELHQVVEINARYRGRIFKNKKTGNLYQVVVVAFDATNNNEGNPIVIYQATESVCSGVMFARNFDEFVQKFDNIEITVHKVSY